MRKLTVKDPYANNKFKSNPYAKKSCVTGEVVVVLDGRMPDRGLELITPISRCVRCQDVHEMILTDEKSGPGSKVNNIAYLGFMQLTCSGVIINGDEVYINDYLIGTIAGFDETHMPNHQNIVIYTQKLDTGVSLNLKTGMTVKIKMAEKGGTNMKSVEEKLTELGLQLPIAPKPVASYVPAVLSEGYVYTSGQIPFVEGELKYKGKVGQDLDEAQGYEAAKICCLNCLSVIKAQIGDLNRIERVVKVVGFVNSAAGFTMQPKIINGASDLLGELFGERGQHARSAVGVSELPLGAACEVELMVKIK